MCAAGLLVYKQRLRVHRYTWPRILKIRYKRNGFHIDLRPEPVCIIIFEYLFQPVAIETLGPLNASAVNFLSEVGRRLTSLSGDPRETSFLFKRLSMLIQRFNSALITDSFCFADEDPDL